MVLVRLVLGSALVTACVVSFLVFAAALAFVAETAKTVPDHTILENYDPAQVSQLLDVDGRVIQNFASQFRRYRTVDEIPPHVIRAFVSAEDRRFLNHKGLDYAAIIRAFLTNVSSGSSIGGSTITQQVAKNLIVGNDRTMIRKVREAIVALRMERDIGKDRILEIYLNDVYLGAGAYGVEAAAERYFGLPLDRISIAQAATLAGLPKAPTTYDPTRNPTGALERRNYVLRRMSEDGWITQAALPGHLAEPLGIVGKDTEKRTEGVASLWYQREVRRSLAGIVGEAALEKGGLQVRTALATDIQEISHHVLRRNLVELDLRWSGYRGAYAHVDLPVTGWNVVPETPEGAEAWTRALVTAVSGKQVTLEAEGRGEISVPLPKMARGAAAISIGDVVVMAEDATGKLVLAQVPELEGAVVVLDPQSGDVLAMSGGFSPERSQFNRVTQAKRQPGSLLKPLLYLQALGDGYEAGSPLIDIPAQYRDGSGEIWSPGASKTGVPLVPMFRALEASSNHAAVRLLRELGPDRFGTFARSLGLTMPDRVPLSAALGSIEETPLSIAAAYATIANGGRQVSPRTIAEFSAGTSPLFNLPGGIGEQVVDPLDAAILADMMRGVVQRGTARSAFDGFEGDLAGKTGTTNEGRDVWFAAFSKDVVVVAWLGYDDNRPLPERSSGGGMAAPVVRQFLEEASVYFDFELDRPEGVSEVLLDPASGLPSKDGVPQLMRSK